MIITLDVEGDLTKQNIKEYTEGINIDEEFINSIKFEKGEQN